MSLADHYRYFLTMLFWALILEIIVIVYYAASSLYDRFEFALTLFLFIITVIAIAIIIRNIRKELREHIIPTT
ncbi:conserved hypothetical protein [Ignisphaera aggregans DSM 17230]|uniref:Uncharacterized protein n=1 Tax=Ignisphaera aggregans (strain DSM 17230 / JCM 13409 / AQ1.S1) TaxID=583356 RepID=E0SQR1_IGNAA|nr:conserved hypothetical protein [Ignisphaera aggregans DSM 17230]